MSIPFLPFNPTHMECARFLSGIVDSAIPDTFMTFILVVDKKTARAAQLGNMDKAARIALLEDALEQARNARE